MPSITRNIRQQADGRWRVRYKLGVREVKRVFDTETQAKEFLRLEKQRILAKGRAALALTQEQDARIMTLLTELSAGKGYESAIKHLEWAVKAYKKAGRNSGEPTVPEVVENLISAWKKAGRAEKYVSNAGGILRRFGTTFQNKTMRALTPRDVSDWIIGLKAKDPRTPKARISKLFAFAVVDSLVEANYVKELQLERRQKAAIQIPSYGEIKRVMDGLILAPKYHPLVPGYSRRLFTGARADEERDKRVRVEGDTLVVPAGAAAKNGDARQVPLAAAALAWDKWCAGHEILECTPAQLVRLDRRFRKEMGMTGELWQNWQRHSYASYQLPLLGDNLEELAARMGNSVTVLKNNYLGNVSADEIPLFGPFDRLASRPLF